MPDTDRLALADELEKLANGGSMGYYVANESLLREPPPRSERCRRQRGSVESVSRSW